MCQVKHWHWHWHSYTLPYSSAKFSMMNESIRYSAANYEADPLDKSRNIAGEEFDVLNNNKGLMKIMVIS